MQRILDALDFILSTIKSVWDFFVGLIENLILLVQYIGNALGLATSCIASMPEWLQSFALITVSVSVLYLILGRGGGTSD